MRCILSYSQPIESLEIPFLATNFPFLVGATVLALLGFFRESVALMICGLVSLVFHFWQCVDGQGSCRVQFCLVGDFLACGLMGAVTVGYASRSLTDLSICACSTVSGVRLSSFFKLGALEVHVHTRGVARGCGSDTLRIEYGPP